MTTERSTVRASGYVTRAEEIWYGISGPFYDAMTCFLPLGGEHSCRREFVEWFGIEPGHNVLSLCCGTGTTERAIFSAVPSAHVTAIDLGPGRSPRRGGRTEGDWLTTGSATRLRQGSSQTLSIGS